MWSDFCLSYPLIDVFRYLERRKEKKAKKKRKVEPEGKGEKADKDQVEFGEVAERPPSFTAAPKPKVTTACDLLLNLLPECWIQFFS